MPAVCGVATIGALDNCIDALSSKHVKQLAIDLQGVNLCREGRVCLIQIFAKYSNAVWIIDVTTLKSATFEHLDAQGRGLKSVLENPATQKLLFDLRSDADALWNLYGVQLANVYDIQLLDVAVKRSVGNYVPVLSGLGHCIEEYLGAKADEWKRVKEEGAKLFRPQLGGSYEVFEKRPLDPVLIQYAAQDVALLFALRSALESRVGVRMRNWEKRVVAASAAREELAHGPFEGNGKHKIIAPKF